MNKKLVLTLLATFLISFALAVPVIQVLVQKLGAGSSLVLSPANKAVVNHVFVISNGKIELAYVKVAFDQDLDAGTRIRVELRDAQDNVIAYADTTLSQALPAKTFIQLELSPHLNLQSIFNYDHIVVVVAGVELSL
ncbi:MAG: hypothetical protein ACP5KW_11055 [Thermoproteota archaeon]